MKLEHNIGKNLILKCSFDLLNPGDEFTLAFVCLGEGKDPPKVDARIEGIKQIHVEEATLSAERAKKVKGFGEGTAIVGVLLILLSCIFFIFNEKTFVILYLLVGIVYVILGLSFEKMMQTLKKLRSN